MHAQLSITEEELEQYFIRVAEGRGMPPLFQKFESDTVYSDDIPLHLDILVADEKAPSIVFIPGTSIYAMCYAELLYEVYKLGYNIVAFDPRGNGLSGGKRGSYTLNEIITDARNVITYTLERFNEKVSIFGSSQGGITAFYVAALEADRIQSAICQNIAELGTDEANQLTRWPTLSKLSKPFLLGAAKLFPELPVSVLTYLDLEKEKVSYFGNAKEFILQDPLALKFIRLKAMASLVTTRPPKPVEEITTPIFVIQPGHDNIFPVSYTKKLFERLTCKKRLDIVPATGHTILSENVDVVIPRVKEWLEEIYQQKPATTSSIDSESPA